MTVLHKSLSRNEHPTFSLHTGEDYFTSLEGDINSADHGTITLSTMGFNPTEPKVSSVIDSLSRASERGVDVTMAIDNFAYLDKTGVGPLGRYSPVDNVQFADLAAKGIFARAANFPNAFGFYYAGLSPTYTGRSHIKSAVVNDKLYVGGISLDATDRLDAMVSVENAELAYNVLLLSRAAMISSSVKEFLRGKDYDITFDEQTESQLIVDAGVRNQSHIFNEAIAIIGDAQEQLVYASEQFPNARIGKHLLRAFNRGVDVKIALNHPSKHDRYTGIHAMILASAKKKYPAEFFSNQLPEDFPTLHTKALASEKRATIGSHNLNEIGVRLGTAEMNIVSSEPNFVRGVGELVLGQIAKGSEYTKKELQ